MEILKPSETLTEESSFEGEKRICNICTTSSDYHLLALLFVYSFIQYLLSTYDVRTLRLSMRCGKCWGFKIGRAHV